MSVAVPSSRGSAKIPEYGHNGLTYVEGREGQNYVIRLRNDTAQRVLAVISVDGLNVIDGQSCTPQSRGYVIPAYSSSDIEGWRINLEAVHKFCFKPKDQSYAKSAAGESNNCGIIAAKFFSLKVPKVAEHHHHHYHYPKPEPIAVPVPWRHPWFDRTTYPDVVWTVGTGSATYSLAGCSNSLAGCSNSLDGKTLTSASTPDYGTMTGAIRCCASTEASTAASTVNSNIPEFKLGTGWGELQNCRVTESDFERDSEICTLAIYYACAEELTKIGIQLEKSLKVTPPSPVLPQAFTGFCKPPVSR